MTSTQQRVLSCANRKRRVASVAKRLGDVLDNDLVGATPWIATIPSSPPVRMPRPVLRCLGVSADVPVAAGIKKIYRAPHRHLIEIHDEIRDPRRSATLRLVLRESH